jgi:hypothetical protein
VRVLNSGRVPADNKTSNPRTEDHRIDENKALRTHFDRGLAVGEPRIANLQRTRVHAAQIDAVIQISETAIRDRNNSMRGGSKDALAPRPSGRKRASVDEQRLDARQVKQRIREAAVQQDQLT